MPAVLQPTRKRNPHMTTYVTRFEKVELPAEQVGKCPVCNKRVVRRTTFWQTINPFNTDAEGTIKTYGEIREELIEESKAWEPDFTHEKCRSKEGAAA